MLISLTKELKQKHVENNNICIKDLNSDRIVSVQTASQQKPDMIEITMQTT